MNSNQIEKRYQAAREEYAQLGVDTEAALQALSSVALSIHCWQGDDVGGFEAKANGALGGGIAATGNYPARRARSQSCARIWKSCTRCCRAGTAWPCT